MEHVTSNFNCCSCVITLKTVKSYVDHQILHRHEANTYYPCCFIDCKQKFMKYTALKSHVYRSHNSRVSQVDDSHRSFVCEDVNCKKQCTDLQDLLAHLKVHMSKNELVHCPFNNCNKAFKVKLSFTAHVSRTHRHESDVNTRVTYSEPSASSQIVPNETETRMAQSESQSQVREDTDLKSLYMRSLCLFYMHLQAKYLVPSSTIQIIVEEINSLNGICHQHTKDRIKETFRLSTNMSDIEIESVFDSIQDLDLHARCSMPLSTEYTRRQYLKKNFGYVRPVDIYLGKDEHRRDYHAQYVPVSNTITAILKDPIVLKECVDSQTRPVSDGILSDISDGSVFKSKELFFQTGDTILKLILYQDAFEVVNPLGSSRKKHTILGVYFTLADFEPFHRSSIENMQLVLLCKETDFKYFGQEKVFFKMFSSPCRVNEKANTLGGQAAENWCLLRLLLVIIGDKVDPCDPAWQLLITLKELVELVYPVDNISSLKVMEEWTSGLTSSFSSLFSQEDVVRLLGVFENLGVGSTEDLKEMDDSSSIATSQNEEASAGENSFFSDNDEIALNVHSAPNIAATWSLGSPMRSQPSPGMQSQPSPTSCKTGSSSLATEDSSWHYSFEVPWNKMASNTRRILRARSSVLDMTPLQSKCCLALITTDGSKVLSRKGNLKVKLMMQRKAVKIHRAASILSQSFLLENGIRLHFRELTGVDITLNFDESTETKFKRILRYFQFQQSDPTNTAGAVLSKTLAGGDETCAAVLMLLAHFREKQEKMLVAVYDTAIASEVDVKNLPSTPCIWTKLSSTSSFPSLLKPYSSCSAHIKCKTLTLLWRLLLHLSSCRGVLMPEQVITLNLTLENSFSNRCIFKINPDKGTKVKRKEKGRQHAVNPR
ncbi:hypothetical protein F7725_017506, partial [Dissostichus mawsoni]